MQIFCVWNKSPHYLNIWLFCFNLLSHWTAKCCHCNSTIGRLLQVHSLMCTGAYSNLKQILKFVSVQPYYICTLYLLHYQYRCICIYLCAYFQCWKFTYSHVYQVEYLTTSQGISRTYIWNILTDFGSIIKFYTYYVSVPFKFFWTTLPCFPGHTFKGMAKGK